MAFVNCEKQCDALIVGMAGMSVVYAKAPVIPSNGVNYQRSGEKKPSASKICQVGGQKCLAISPVGGNRMLTLAGSVGFQRRNLELGYPRP